MNAKSVNANERKNCFVKKTTGFTLVTVRMLMVYTSPDDILCTPPVFWVFWFGS
jgi:hypothetical protein